ncbi:SIR2 family protein [Rhodopseudomonas palustris]|uniref:SIR2 family protein n=1 Tax=Rhodopseudomonas palustris TaxID=1076 RepID=UPI0018DC605A|nr:SIR2 family protein [Rhodopseudomonas palustris]
MCDLLADELKVARGKYDLQALADAFRRRPELNMYQSLRRLFTISNLSVDQREILKLRWQRIYTTNYDDSVELAFHENGIKSPSYNYDDPKPARVPRGAVIHLHGVIKKATEENIHQQLVLGRQSYIRQFFAKSPWYDEFLRDIRFCEAIFFVGYSLADPHVTALFVNPEQSKLRTYFVLRPPLDSLLVEHIEEYGEAHPIETKGFAQICRSLSAPPPLADLNNLRILRWIDPFKDQKTVIQPTSLEVINLVAFGAFDSQRALSTLPNGKYVIPRQKMARRAVQQVVQNRTTLLHGRLGNGKSIFLWILAFHLMALDYQCFRCSAMSPAIDREAKALVDHPKVAILFDSYDVAIDSVDRLYELLPHARFIVCVRSGVQDVRLHEIATRFPSSIARVNLNEFDAEDRSDFIDLLVPAGALKDDLENRIRSCADIREVVATIYENEFIQRRIRESLAPLRSDRSAAAVTILGLLLSWINQTGDPSLYLEALDADPHTTLAKYREVAIDIFRLDDDQIQARSPVFSDYILRRLFSVDEIFPVVEKVLIAAVQRKKERKYRAILSNIMRYSALLSLSKEAPDGANKIIGLYGRLQRDVGIQEEPLFWLQYAIAMTEADSAEIAEGFLRTAYRKAAEAGDFATYQLDTFALRLYLKLEEKAEVGRSVSRIKMILYSTKLVSGMIGDQNHRAYAVRVLEGWLPFVASRVADLTGSQKTKCLAAVDDLLHKISGLSAAVRAETGSDQVKSDLEAAKRTLLLGA